MNMFKNWIALVKETQSTLKDDKKSREFFLKLLTSKKLFIFGTVANVIGLIYYTTKINDSNLDFSLSRWVSRQTGRIGEIPIPSFMREVIYKGYMKMYNVNREEILDQNLKNYKTIKEFFIRQIDLNKRPNESESPEILTSPCDGRVLSISEVENINDLIIVKQVRYSLANFLFGKFYENFPSLSENLFNEKKKTYQMTIYLSPGDCHRYYSPSDILVSHRVYIPGFLEPVRPSYLEKHTQVFATNERVTLRCHSQHSDDLVFITYVGALNVGSINLSFDDFLKTNVKLTKDEKDDPGFYVLNYPDILNPTAKVIERKPFYYYKPSSPLLFKDLDSEAEEFDMRDMIDLDQDIIKDYKVNLDEIKSTYFKFKEKFLYEKILRDNEDLTFTFANCFLSYDLDVHKKRNKLKNPKQLKLESYNMTNKGLQLKRKEEMGWFNFGSTIVLIFTVDKDKEIKFDLKGGDVVKIGQSLFNIEERKNIH